MSFAVSNEEVQALFGQVGAMCDKFLDFLGEGKKDVNNNMAYDFIYIKC